MIEPLATLDAELAAAQQRLDAVAASLLMEEAQHRETTKAHAHNASTPLPSSVVNFRRDRDEAHAAMRTLFRRRVDVLRMVLASRMMDDVIDWNDESAIKGAEELANLVARVDQAESAAGMPAHDIVRADRSMLADIASRAGASSLSARRTALHTRLRDALDFQAEREADALLRVKLGMDTGR